MSRGNDLTCNESLPDDGAGGVSNFSPSTNRTYMSQAPQLFNTNTVDSLAALRDRILQQQPNAQHATSVLQQLQQRNATISTLLSQPGVSGVEALVNQLNQQASTVTADSLLSQLQFLQNRQQQQVASQQLLDNLPSAATLTAALVAQQNIYGALPQLASNLASLNNANVSAEQNARLAAIQQIAASVVGLNVGQPQQSGYLSDNLELPRTNTLAQQLAQVQQRAQVQQHHQHVQAVQNATSSYLNDQNTLQQQAAVSRQSSFANVQQQLLLSNSLYSARNPTSSSAATPQLTQQQISDFLASQQQIPTSRLSDDLARQQLYQAQSQLNQQRSQAETMIAQSSGAYQSLNGGQVNTETPQIGQLLQQYLSRLTSNYGQATSIEKDRENVAAQLQQLGFPDAGHQSTVSPLNFQPSTSQSLNRVPVIGSSTQTHSIVPLQQQSLQQMATALQNESLQLRLQQELQQTAKLAQSSSSLPNNLAASQLAYSQAAVVDRQTPSSPSRNLKRSRPSSSVLSNSQNAASILASASQSNSNLTAENAATRLGRSLLPEELLVLDRARNAAYNMTNIPASTNYSSSHNETASELLLRQHALERQRHHIEPEILEQRRTHASDSNDQTAEGSSTQKGSNQVEHVSTDENRLPNIPTLAAFRQVPGQDLFDHFPKKRIKQDQLGVPDVDIDSAETHRKKNSAEVQLLTSRSKKEFQKQSQLRSPQKFGENVKRDKQVDSVAALGDLVDISVPRKRGRPRTNFTKEKKSTIKSTRSGSTKDDESVDRTILHDAADFFLKPTLPNNQTHSSAVSPAGNRKRVGRKLKDVDQNVVSKINSLAAAITLADEDESMVSEEKRKKSKKASETARSTTQIHNIQELVEKNPVLRNLSNEEVVGVQALLKYYAENEAHNDVEMPEIVKEIASAAGLWEALELTLDSPIPSELSILDYVYNKQHLMELSTMGKQAARFNEDHEGKSKTYGHDPFTKSEKRSIQQMAFQTSIGTRRKEFAKQFIYESMVLRLMNDEYAKLRGDDNPRELFLNNSASYNRADKQFTQRTPLACTVMNQAEVECSLMDQMYRYRAQYFHDVHNRSFVPQFRSKMSPDEMIIMNMDVTKTVYNMVESVATSKRYVSYADETRNFFNRSNPHVSDPENQTVRSSGEAIEKSENDHAQRRNQEFVILRARNETNEIENLKHRLHKHLHENFKELVALHDQIYGIRKRAIHYHREDFHQHRRSVFRLLSENSGRRCASAEPPPITTEKLPLYRKRRCRSVDLKIRNRVVTEVGMCYINNTVETKSGAEDNKLSVSNLEQTERKSEVTVGPKAYHEQWEEDGFMNLSSRFAILINERQQLIAAITKLTLSDMDQQQLLDCAREVDVAVNTSDYQIHATPGRRQKLKSQILLSHEARKNPALFCRLSQEKGYDDMEIATGITADNLESWRRRLGEKILNKFSPLNSENVSVECVQDDEWNEGVVEDTTFTKRALKMFGQRLKDSTTRFPHTQTIHEKEQQHMIEQLTDRAFHDELLFRHLLTASIKLYSFLDPIVHDEFVEKLKKLEAPRLDKLMRMRSDFTISYLFGIPQYETTSEIPKKNHGQDNVRIAPGPEVFDEMFGGKDRNPYRDGLLFPVTTPQSTVETAQLIKYRNRETDSTPAELLSQQMNLNICAKALMRLIYTYPGSFAEELAHFTNHPAFHVLNTEQGDDNGFPCSVYQSSIQKAVQTKKSSVDEREMPEFQNDSEAETYFTNRSRMAKERIASLLTVGHKRKALNRRCFKTMEKLSGVMEKQKSELRTVRQHYNSLSSRGKKMFLKRYRVGRYNQATRFDPEVPIEDNLNAPLPVPGFNPPDMHQGAENWIDLPDFVRNEILSQPKPPPVVVEESRSTTRGGRGGTRGRGGNRGGRRRGGRC